MRFTERITNAYQAFRGMGNKGSQTTFTDIWNRGAAWAPMGVNGSKGVVATLENVPMFAAVRVMAGGFSLLDIRIRKETEKGFEPVTNHPLRRTFRRFACPGITPSVCKFGMMASRLIYGRAFAEIERLPDGKINLWPMPPRYVKTLKNENGDLIYRVILPGSGPVADLDPTDVIELKNLPVDAYNSPDTSWLLSDAFDAMAAGSNFSKTYLESGLSIGGVLKLPTQVKPEVREKLRAEWMENYTGAKNAGKIAIIEKDMEFAKFDAPSLGDAKISDIGVYSAEEISRITGCPLSWLAHPATASSTNPESKSAELAQALEPAAKEFCEEHSLKLLGEDDPFEIFQNVDQLVKPLFATRIDGLVKGVLGGIIQPAEARASEGREFVEGSDKLLIPANLSSIGQQPGAPLPGADKSQPLLNPSTPAPLDVGAMLSPAPTPAPTSADTPTPPTEPIEKAPVAIPPTVENVAATALNGAQVASLVELVNQAGAGLLPIPSAKAIAAAAFPFFKPEQLDQIFAITPKAAPTSADSAQPVPTN